MPKKHPASRNRARKPQPKNKSAPPRQLAISLSRGAHTRERAAFWRVSLRTMQNMLAERPPVPVDDTDAMIRWYAALPSATQSKLTRALVTRIMELRLERERITGAPIIMDADYADFERDHATATPDNDRIAKLKRLADYAVFKIERATKARDLSALSDAQNLLARISSTLHDEELRAQKLGRALGNLLPQESAESLARALAYWLLRSIDAVLADVCPRIATASASGQLFREEVRALIEPTLLAHRLLEPLARASKHPAALALPVWWIDALRSGLAATLEDGARAFDDLRAPAPAESYWSTYETSPPSPAATPPATAALPSA